MLSFPRVNCVEAALSLLVPQDDLGHKLDDMLYIERRACREEALDANAADMTKFWKAEGGSSAAKSARAVYDMEASGVAKAAYKVGCTPK